MLNHKTDNQKPVNVYITFQHYDAIMKYVSQGPLFVDVHMHRPHTTSRHFMDSLLAFWPGLQVGYTGPAELLYHKVRYL